MNEELIPLIAEEIVVWFVNKEQKHKDRDYHEDWIPYGNFSEFYADNKRFFAVGYSDSDKIVKRIVRLYLLWQLEALYKDEDGRKRTATDENLGKGKAVIDAAIEERFADIKAALQAKYPAELAEIIKNNDTFYAALGGVLGGLPF